MSDDVQLSWRGKRPALVPDPPPVLEPIGQPVDTAAPLTGNVLITGDNLLAMAAMAPELAGRFALIYLDPPFFTGKEFQSRSADQNPTGFSDGWPGGLAEYLQWLFDRISLARALLAPTGCLYLHLSWHVVHHAKLIMDEVFGDENFQNEIIWFYREA